MTQEQFDLACGFVWLACAIVCVLKLRWGLIVEGVVVSIIVYVGPMITGNYLTNILWPLAYAPVWGALRLAHPESYWANWFYRRNLHKYWRSVERFGMIAEYSARIAGNVEASQEFEAFLRRKLTPEQRLAGLKTTEAAEVAKLTRLGQDAYVAEKVAEIQPKIDAHIAELREREKNKKVP
jgi:cell fate (sporulation/competence/biofilm development) regulator YlbF (YheA/YmcA/DUF963 family)